MRPITAIAAAVAAAVSPPAAGDRNGVSQPECAVTRILVDGREVRSKVAATAAVSSVGRSANGSSAVSVSGRGSAGSSVSVSSSSSSSGGGSSRAVSSYTDETGRTVTTTRDERGCTIVVDERQ